MALLVFVCYAFNLYLLSEVALRRKEGAKKTTYYKSIMVCNSKKNTCVLMTIQTQFVSFHGFKERK